MLLHVWGHLLALVRDQRRGGSLVGQGSGLAALVAARGPDRAGHMLAVMRVGISLVPISSTGMASNLYDVARRERSAHIYIYRAADNREGGQRAREDVAATSWRGVWGRGVE